MKRYPTRFGRPAVIALAAGVSLFETNAGRAEATLMQLQTLEVMVSSKNCNGLSSFLRSNPDLMRGDDPLARELRIFSVSSKSGARDCFDSRASILKRETATAVVRLAQNPAPAAPTAPVAPVAVVTQTPVSTPTLPTGPEPVAVVPTDPSGTGGTDPGGTGGTDPGGATP